MDNKTIKFSPEFIQQARNTLQIDGELMFVGDGTNGNPYISNGMVWVHQRDESGMIVKIEAVELPVGTGVELSAGTAVIVGTNRERKRGIISMSADGLKRQGKNIYQYNPLDLNLPHGFGRHDFTMMQISATQPLSSMVRINQMVWVNRRGHHENISNTPGFIEIDLSTSIPSANEHRLSTIFFDPLSGSFGVSDGTSKSILDQMTNADISETLPALPANSIPIFCLRLIGGDTAINPVYGRNLWLDMRQLINLPDAIDRLSFNYGGVVTIDSGGIDASFTVHKVKSESGLPDDLEQINGAESGQLLILKADVNNIITVINTGNIKLPKNVVLRGDNILTLLHVDGDWHSLSYQPPKQNLQATTAPTANDDESSGYEVMSQWRDTTSNDIYICADASLGMAIWKQL